MFSKTVRRGSGTPTAKVLLWPILHENYIKIEKNGSRGKGNSSLASRLDYLVLIEHGPLYITLWFTSVTPIGIFSIITSPFSGKPLNMKKDKIFRIPVQFHRRIHFHVVFEKNGLNNRLALGTPTFVVGAPSPCEI